MRLLGLRSLAVVVGLLIFFPFSAVALITVGAIETSGSANHVDVVGGLAYVTDGCSSVVGGLRILDVSNPAAPVQLGSLDTGDAQAVQVVGGLAYVAGVARTCNPSTFPSGLRIVDVSNPAAPDQLGSLDTSEAWDVEVVGSLAYLADGPTALRIIDVSNPAAPAEVGRLDLSGEDVRGVEVVGSLAYLADASDALRIVDVSNPAAPVQLGVLATPDSAFDVAVAGGLAYVAAGSAGLRIVDVSDPSTPVEIGSIPLVSPSMQDLAHGVELVGQLAYVSGSSGLWVIDVANPAAPMVLGGLLTPGVGTLKRRAALVGALVYMARGRGLQIIDISSPSLPREVGALDTPGLALDVELVGGLTYLADGSSGLRVVDASDPAAPFELGSLDTPGLAVDVEVVGGLAYVADSTGGLRIIDVSNPAVPVELGSFASPSNAQDVEVANGLAYLAARTAGLSIVDISDPSAPVEIGALATPDSDAFGIEVVGNLVYLANDSADGLQIVDVSNPAAPALLASFVPSGSDGGVKDVAVVGNRAYLAANSGLIVLDVSSPAAPLPIGGPLELPGPLVDVEVVGSLACVAAAGGGLWAVDVSNPAAPFALGAPISTGREGDVEVLGGLAYLANGFEGLRVVSFGPEYAPKAPAPGGPKLYEASLSIHVRGNDQATGASYPYTAAVFIARPLGAQCNPAFGGAVCGNATLQQGAPLAGSGTASVMGTVPRSFTLPRSGLTVPTRSRYGSWPLSAGLNFGRGVAQVRSHPRSVTGPYYPHVTLRNSTGSFHPGGGPGNHTFSGAFAGPGTARWSIHAGPNQFGGTMRLLGHISERRVLRVGKGGNQYLYAYALDLFSVLGGRCTSVGVCPSSPVSQATDSIQYFTTPGGAPGVAFTTLDRMAWGYAWTTGTVSVTALDIEEGTPYFPTVFSRRGYDNRTQYGDGTIQLVTPQLIHWDYSVRQGLDHNTGAIGVLRIAFAPEPKRWLQLVAGLGFLGVLYRRRARGSRIG